MKKFDFSKNISLKIIAVIFAALLWFFVANIDDPIGSESFSDIPITIANPEVVTNDGKTYKIMDDISTVRVVVRAKGSVLSKIKSKDITAIVDLRERDADTSIVPITAVVSGYENEKDVVTETNPNNILVRVEDVTNKSFPISVRQKGTPRGGYAVGEMKVNPERIQIGGSKSMIEDIQRVVAEIDVTGMSEDGVVEADLSYYDGNGNSMDQSALSNNLGDKGVSVSVQILRKKEVDLKFNVSGTPASGYRYTGLNCEPDRIEVCGTKEDLEDLETIEIPGTAINLEGLSSREQYTIDITPYLPEGVQLADETANNVIVSVMVEKEGTRTILLPIGAIKIKNLDEGLSVTMETAGDLEVLFTGAEDLLEKLDILNAASIDLRTYKEPGTYDVPVNIEVDSNVILSETPMVSVTLTKKPEETVGGEETDE